MSNEPGTRRFTGTVEEGVGLWPIRVHEVTVTHSDLTAAATSEAIDIATDDNGDTFPASARILDVSAVVDVPFSGGSVSALVLDVGNTGDSDEWLDDEDVFGASAGDVLHDGGAAGTFGALEATAYAPEALFTATGDNVVNLDAGRVRIYIKYIACAVDPRA